MDLAEHLPLIPIFHGLDEEQYLMLAARFHDYRAVIGDELIKQGDLINRFFIIDEGVIALHHTDAEGVPLPMGTLGTGRYFGEQMFTTQELANFTADAPQGAKLHLLEHDDWDALTKQRPDILQHLDHLHAELQHLTHGVTWLAPGEVIVHFGHKHWIGLVEGAVRPVLFLLVGLGVLAALLFVNPIPIPLPVPPDPSWLYGAMALVVVLTALWLLAVWYDFENDEHIITNKRLVHTERNYIFNEIHEEIPVEKIQQVTVQRGNLLQVLVGVSKVWIESAAVKRDTGTEPHAALGDVELESVLHGEEIRQVVEAQRDKVRARLAAEVRSRTQGRMQRELAHYVRPELNHTAEATEVQAESKPKVPRRVVVRRALHTALGQKFVEGDTVTYRKHWIALLDQIKLWVGLFLGLIVISVGYFASGSDLIPVPYAIGALIFLGFLCFSGLVYQWEDWRNDIYRLTPMRVIDIERKPFGMDERSTTAFLENIQDVKYEMPSFIQNQFKFGEVLIYTAGAKEPLVFHTVKEPRTIALEIFKRMEAAKIRKAEREEGLRNRQLVDALVAYHRLVARPEEPEPEFKIAAPPVTLQADEQGQVAIPDLTPQVQFTGNLVPAGHLFITQTPEPGTIVRVGAYKIAVLAKDEGGHEAAGETNLSVVDTLPPQVKCSDSLVIAADDDGTANIPNVIPNVRALDNSTPPERLRFEQKPKPGTRVAVGIHALRVTVTDEAGNAAWDEMLLTVVDRTPPRLRAPAQINLVANADHPTVIPNLVARVEANDNCTPAHELVWTQAPAPGTPVDPGTALVTLTVKDKAGNLSTAQITLNVVNAPEGMGARLAAFIKRTPPNSASSSSPNSTTVWRPSARPRSRAQRVIVPDKKSDK